MILWGSSEYSKENHAVGSRSGQENRAELAGVRRAEDFERKVGDEDVHRTSFSSKMRNRDETVVWSGERRIFIFG